MTYDREYRAAMAREYTHGLWWITFLSFWDELAEVLSHQAAINAIKARYIKPGRPTGYRKPRAPAPKVGGQ